MFDWVLLGFSTIGYLEIGFYLVSSLIGSSLGPSVIGSSFGYSVVGSSLGYSLESWWKVPFRVLLRFPSDSVLIRVLSLLFVLCTSSGINNLRSFPMIFCFGHFNSNRCFGSFFGKFNTINGNLGKFLNREKRLYPRFLIGSWIHLCGAIYIQKDSSKSIPKDTFSERFFKIAKKSFLDGVLFKEVLLHGCYPVKQLFMMFS